MPLHHMPSIADSRRLMASGQMSASELLADAIRHIERHNPAINALPTLCLDRALQEARGLDNQLMPSRRTPNAGRFGPLTGQPYCAKDLFDTEDIRTTYGSTIFAHHVPERDDDVVARIRRAGAVLLGKSNTPEFAAGSQTFNRVFGATRNPHDPTRTTGGSTGGGAAALACGMVNVADGSDLAASLRNPASFCGVAGMRASSHLDPRLQPGRDPFNTLSMVGPLARSIADLREIFLAIFDPQGCQPQRSLSHWVALRDRQESARIKRRHAWRGGRRLRIGWAPTWDRLAVDAAVLQAMDRFASRAAEAGMTLVEGFPILPDVRSAFLALRGEYFVAELHDLHRQHPGELKDTIVWNIEQGLRLTTAELIEARKIRAATRICIEHYMDDHQLDVVAGPTCQVLPFDLQTPYVEQIGETRLETYIDWLASNFFVTVAGLPAISLPTETSMAPDTGASLPVGVQLIGRWGTDMDLLDAAQLIEETL